MPSNDCSWIKATDASVKPLRAAKHCSLTADNMRLSLVVGRQLCGQVTAADVFGEGCADIAFDFGLEIHAGADYGGRVVLCCSDGSPVMCGFLLLHDCFARHDKLL